jgi:hypothetical protein
MTELQFDQVFRLLEQDKEKRNENLVVPSSKRGKMEPTDIVHLLIAYETWLYEK